MSSLSLLLCVGLAGTACVGAINGHDDEAPGTPDGPRAAGKGQSGSGGAAGVAAGSPAGVPGMPGQPGMPAPAGPPPVATPTTRLARLSHAQWTAAVKDLLRLPARPAFSDRFRGDPINTFDTIAETLSVDEALRGDYRDAAEQLAEQVTTDPAALARIVPPVAAGDVAARSRDFVDRFGVRAYRRPLTKVEADRFVTLMGRGPAVFGGKDAFTDGVRVAVQAFLQSVHFLYRTELGPATAMAATGRQALGPYDRAARIALAVTGTIPDDALLVAAGTAELTTSDGVRRQVERLLGTPAAGEVIDSFHRQWLRMITYEGIEKDAKLFPEYSAGIGADMESETLKFARDVVDGGGGFNELLLSPTTFVNKRLAVLYGMPAPAAATGLTKVNLDPTKRAGLLTQAGFLASNASIREVDSIHRGVFVHHQFLCTELPPPAANVSFAGATGTTNRQKVTSVTGDGTCGAGCHSSVINPVGFAFEQYDALGKFRTSDKTLPADASGKYAFDGIDKTWTTGIEFVKLMASSQTAHNCFSRFLFSYLHGRTPEPADVLTVAGLGQKSLESKVSVKALLTEIATSDQFLTRLP